MTKKTNINKTSFIENSVEKDALLPQEEFLKKYKISSKVFEGLGLKWSTLKKIHSDYSSNQGLLKNIEKDVYSNFLNDSAKDIGVHSVRSRLKSPDGLIEKIIRKTIDARKKGGTKNFRVSNYMKEIDDLIGVRVLHVFKNDWYGIHNFILNICNYKTKESPIVYYRKGDETSFIDNCIELGCQAKVHPKAYRSIHYIIEPYPNKNLVAVEIQVRTVFEDGWSEIDHQLRYSSKKGTKHPLDSYLLALNRIAGSADEIGTLIKNRQAELNQEEYERRLNNKGE